MISLLWVSIFCYITSNFNSIINSRPLFLTSYRIATLMVGVYEYDCVVVGVLVGVGVGVFVRVVFGVQVLLCRLQLSKYN